MEQRVALRLLFLELFVSFKRLLFVL